MVKRATAPGCSPSRCEVFAFLVKLFGLPVPHTAGSSWLQAYRVENEIIQQAAGGCAGSLLLHSVAAVGTLWLVSNSQTSIQTQRDSGEIHFKYVKLDLTGDSTTENRREGF